MPCNERRLVKLVAFFSGCKHTPLFLFRNAFSNLFFHFFLSRFLSPDYEIFTLRKNAKIYSIKVRFLRKPALCATKTMHKKTGFLLNSAPGTGTAPFCREKETVT
jgi:hypothetical protein